MTDETNSHKEILVTLPTQPTIKTVYTAHTKNEPFAFATFGGFFVSGQFALQRFTVYFPWLERQNARALFTSSEDAIVRTVWSS